MTESDESEIRQLLDTWTRATREGRHDEVLKRHARDVVIYDVLPPLRYTSAAAYRASWDDWQPDAQGTMRFELEDLKIRTGADTAFAYGMLQCGGTLPSGKPFRDTVRATFCLAREDGGWTVVHQHISKPAGP